MHTTLIRSTLTYLLLAVSTYAIDNSDCGSSKGTTIWNVQLLDCDHLEVCELVRGNKTTLDVDFKTDSKSNQTKMLIHGKIGGFFLPFAFPQKDACENSGLTCPMESNKNYTYHAEVDVKKIYPPLRVDLRFKLVDVDSNEILFCVLILAKLV